jgi:tetratricopeptide (TPR) repeat protein
VGEAVLEPKTLGRLGGLVQQVFGSNALTGRLGLVGCSVFLPGLDPETAQERCLKLVRVAAKELHLDLAAGFVALPYLHLTRADAPEAARKALDHALLLPAPRVAGFDSTSLTVSADRLFARGDLYSALEEYKLALLADEDNLLAANSLGICYTRLHKHAQAAALFDTVAAKDQENLMAWYNLGSVCLKLGETTRARAAFERCQELNPDHVFSTVRLGQLDEADGDTQSARERYLAVAQNNGGAALGHRHLARLDLAAGRTDEARERLHQALLANPRDPAALAMLAGLYLDAGQDPEIAEALARQCTALAPSRIDGWRLLARALEAGGKTREARDAEAQAETL